ncbi:MAG: M20/M25/M40 family metallo-hydrolase [Clostridia bacterium]|nr:M20/M25/M40 family metallo-hydrolase [Clostridia bacterium]
MISYETLFEAIDRLSERFIRFWIDICNIESPTVCKSGVDAVGRYFADYARSMGWTVETFPQPVSGDVVCITMNPDAPAKPLTLSAHIDTVHPVGSFGTPPVRCDERHIYGPGVMDCKGGGAAAMLAMTALHECGFDARPVRLLLQSDEEANSIGSNKTTIDYICKKSADSIGFLNCESIRGSTAVLWRRGIARYRLDIAGKAIHASRCNEGASAITEAAFKIIELEKMKDVNGLTCNCGLIDGGDAENTVPDRCTLHAEVRFDNNAQMEEADRIVGEIAAICHVPGTSCTLTKTIWRCAMEKCRRNFDFLDTINRIYADCGLPALTARQSLGGSDAADVTAYGIPCIDSVGVAGDYIHTRDEYAVLSSLAEAAKRLAAVANGI